jgi:hypothetical protein
MQHGSREQSCGGTEYNNLDEIGTDKFNMEPEETSLAPDHSTSRNCKEVFVFDVKTSASVACLERLWMSESLYARVILSLNQSTLWHSAMEAEL